ncbi:hypothetical protein BHM03_00006687 [Ensete ventricosum]|nr:hypothetical protein BHM03_00006687 [Ensete ventricosum]
MMGGRRDGNHLPPAKQKPQRSHLSASSSSSRFLLPPRAWAHGDTIRVSPVVVPTFEIMVHYCGKNRHSPPPCLPPFKRLDKKIEELGVELGNGGSPDKFRKLSLSLLRLLLCHPSLHE